MIIQNSLLLLNEISELEAKISLIEKVIHNNNFEIDLEVILEEIISKST